MATDPFADIGVSRSASPTRTRSLAATDDDPFASIGMGAQTTPASSPSFMSRIGSGLMTAAGAQKRLVDRGIDYLSGIDLKPGQEPVPTGDIVKNALLPADAAKDSYLQSAARPVIGFATDLLTDPLTYETAGLGKFVPMLAKAAGVGFTGMMGHGAYEQGKAAVERYQQEGFTPQVLEEGLGAALLGTGAVLGAKHLVGGEHAPSPRVTEEVRPAEVATGFDPEATAQAMQRARLAQTGGAAPALDPTLLAELETIGREYGRPPEDPLVAKVQESRAAERAAQDPAPTEPIRPGAETTAQPGGTQPLETGDLMEGVPPAPEQGSTPLEQTAPAPSATPSPSKVESAPAEGTVGEVVEPTIPTAPADRRQTEGQAPATERRVAGQDRRELAHPESFERRVAAQIERVRAEHPDYNDAQALKLARSDVRGVTDRITGLLDGNGWDQLKQTVNPETDHVVNIDLRRFKAVNDQIGEPMGDKVLSGVGNVLRKHFGDESARYGGDEYIGVLRNHDFEAATGKAEAFRQDLAQLHMRLKSSKTGELVDINGMEAHIGVGANDVKALEARVAAAAPFKVGGRGDIPVSEIGAQRPGVGGSDAGVAAVPERGVEGGGRVLQGTGKELAPTEPGAPTPGEAPPPARAASVSESKVPAPPIDKDSVRRAFPSAKISRTEEGFHANLGQGREVRVLHGVDGIEYNAGAFKAGYGRDISGAEKVVGSWSRVDRGGIIQLAKEGATDATLLHESFHAAMDLALSEKQKRAVLKAYGSEEAAADAYGKWKPENPHGAFQQIKAFFSRIYRSFVPSGESVFSDVRSGKAFEQGGESGPVRQAFATAAEAVGDTTGNFLKWFGNSKVADKDGAPREMYHGSQGDWSAWDSGRGGGLINLTDNPGVAANYAEGGGGGRRSQGASILVDHDTGVTWHHVEEGGKQAYVNDKTGERIDLREAQKRVDGDYLYTVAQGANVKPLYVRAENTLDLLTPDGRAVLKGIKADTRTGQIIVQSLRDNDQFHFGDTKHEHATKVWRDDLIPKLKALGYDSIRHGDDGGHTLAVFEPTQIKSAMGNSGKFDPANPDIRYATAPAEPPSVSKVRPIPEAKETEKVTRLHAVSQSASERVAKIADTFTALNEKFQIAMEGAERIEERGTIAKEERAAFREAGQPSREETRALRFSEKDIVSAGRELVDAAEEMRKAEDQFKRQADPNSAETMKVARQVMEQAVKGWQVYRSAAGRAVKAFDRAIPESVIHQLREAGTLANLKEVKPKVPITTNIIQSLGKWKDLNPAEKRRFWSDVVEQYRLNLFSVSSFTLDLVGNMTEAVAQGTSGLGYDLMKATKGDVSFPSMQGMWRAIRSNAAFKEATPAIEKALSRTAGGEHMEGAGTFTERKGVGPEGSTTRKVTKIGSTVYDYLIGGPLYMKGKVDTGAQRFAAMSHLYREAVEHVNKLGVKDPLERMRLRNEFVNSPPEAVAQSAIRAGKSAGFSRDLSKVEERIAGSTASRLLISPFPRWPFQFTRWAGEMVGVNPEVFRKVRAGTLSREELGSYLARTATGLGGLYMLDKALYNRTDFNSMEYVDDDGNRVRLSSRDPVPSALWMLAVLHGDKEKAVAGLRYASVPFASLFSGEGGLLSGTIKAFQGAMANTNNDPRALQRELEDTINRALPGQALLSALKTMFDPVIREGVGANIPGVSKLLPGAINPVTGEELAPRQRIAGLEFPTIGGTPIPGATRVLEPVQKLLSRYGLLVYRGPRNPIAGYPPGRVPEELRTEWEVAFGHYRNNLLTPLARAQKTLEARDPEQVRKYIQERDSLAARYADVALRKKYGGAAKLPREAGLKEKAGPNAFRNVERGTL